MWVVRRQTVNEDGAAWSQRTDMTSSVGVTMTQTRSPNLCWLEQAISIKYYECVFVNLILLFIVQTAIFSAPRYIVICGLSGSTASLICANNSVTTQNLLFFRRNF